MYRKCKDNTQTLTTVNSMATNQPLLDTNGSIQAVHHVIDMESIGDKYDEQTPIPITPTHSSHELAFIRTYFACQRTYMASIRTNAIFVSLSLILVNYDHEVPAMSILFFCVGANLLETYNFYRSFSHFTNIRKRILQIAPSVLYSLLLDIILFYVVFFDADEID